MSLDSEDDFHSSSSCSSYPSSSSSGFSSTSASFSACSSYCSSSAAAAPSPSLLEFFLTSNPRFIIINFNDPLTLLFFLHHP